MKRNTAYITVALIAVLAAAVLSLRLFVGRNAEEPVTPTPPLEIHSPVPDGTETEPPEDSPEPTVRLLPPPVTQTPATQPPAVQTPETQPPATTAPIPADASGSFSSNTGTGLNITADWKTYTDASGAKKLQVDVSAVSYSLFTSELANSLELKVNGQPYYAGTPAINYEGAGVITTRLGSFTVDAPSGTAILTVTWGYKGSYSGVNLEQITATDNVYLGS